MLVYKYVTCNMEQSFHFSDSCHEEFIRFDPPRHVCRSFEF